MNASEYPDAPTGKPLWLITLADLALLLVGFLVLLQATQHIGSKDLAKGIREGFGANDTEPTPPPASSILHPARRSCRPRRARSSPGRGKQRVIPA